jgi:bidirectional [NiFe] hydrogenase diaphorase subunit
VQLAALLDRVVEGRAAAADLEHLEELAAMVKATSLCGLGQSAPNPLLSTLRHFRAEYEGACAQPPTLPPHHQSESPQDETGGQEPPAARREP